MPKVSVILPVFNAASTVERAVRSVLNQDLQDLELIAVNDGSTDSTRSILDAIDDPRLRLIEQQHAGVVVASNRAFQESLSPLVARMDADDYAHPTKLSSQIELLETHDLDVVGCQVSIVDSSGSTVDSMSRYARWINEETLTHAQIMANRFVELPIVNPTILARRQYLEIGFRSNDLPEDYDLMLRAARVGMRFGKVPSLLFDWTDRAGRLTRTDDRYSREAFDACRRHHLLSGPLANAPCVDLWGIGQTGKPWMRWLQKHQIMIRHAFDVNQRVIGQRVHGCVVQSPDQLTNADGTPLMIAVGADGARELIREHITLRGYQPGCNAWFVA